MASKDEVTCCARGRLTAGIIGTHVSHLSDQASMNELEGTAMKADLEREAWLYACFSELSGGLRETWVQP